MAFFANVTNVLNCKLTASGTVYLLTHKNTPLTSKKLHMFPFFKGGSLFAGKAYPHYSLAAHDAWSCFRKYDQY